MKKTTLFIIALIPIIALSSNPPPPGLPDEPTIVPIDSMIVVLFIAGILFGGYVIYKKKRSTL